MLHSRRIVKTAPQLLLLAALALLPASAAQKTITPIRVAVRAPQNEVNARMAAAVREALRDLPERDVAIVENNSDYDIKLNAAPLAGAVCEGYVAAVAVVEWKSRREALDAYSGATIEEIARYVVENSAKEHFEPWREAARKR